MERAGGRTGDWRAIGCGPESPRSCRRVAERTTPHYDTRSALSKSQAATRRRNRAPFGKFAGTRVGGDGRQRTGGRSCAKGERPHKNFGLVVQFSAKWINNRLRCGRVSASLYLRTVVWPASTRARRPPARGLRAGCRSLTIESITKRRHANRWGVRGGWQTWGVRSQHTGARSSPPFAAHRGGSHPFAAACGGRRRFGALWRKPEGPLNLAHLNNKTPRPQVKFCLCLRRHG